jgi:hypothetical protein
VNAEAERDPEPGGALAQGGGAADRPRRPVEGCEQCVVTASEHAAAVG